MLKRKFFERNTKTVAKELLGKVIVHDKCKGKIVETEAYLGSNDPGATGFRMVKTIPEILLGPAGRAFVYFTYGNHWMFNIIATEKVGIPGAVLIRAVEPLEGIEIMKKNRNVDMKNLTNGPGKFTQAFGIGKKHNGLDVTKGKLYFESTNEKPEIITTTRIGLSAGQDLKLRYYIKDNKFVSRK